MFPRFASPLRHRPVPEYRIRTILKSKTLQRLRFEDFSHADIARLCDTITGKSAHLKTEARLVWDSKFLYVCFTAEGRCQRATLTRHDAPLHKERVVEFFVDPAGTGKAYYEFQVNPLNTAFDALILNNAGRRHRRGPIFKGLPDWNPVRFYHRVDKTKERWRVFMKIAFAELFLAPTVPPKKGERWRANFLRIDRVGKRKEYQAYSPTYWLDFHVPSRFAGLTFV
ncbi:MAG: hypothetical protein A2293_00775 [Elusimicrobia bacterium RIFOXYB2_FULL_49_7]|nr:MAG: hypothetical protein A2293_00775 [Elusimicrobia bacterium RIFOXYB2_FULL_49_7]